MTVGQFGEDTAAAYLRKNGYRILHRNWHGERYEIDIIAKNRECIALVEVKARRLTEHTADKYGPPSAAINREKQRHILAAAREYAARHRPRLPLRLDVIEVWLDPQDTEIPRLLKLHHMTDAFRA